MHPISDFPKLSQPRAVTRGPHEHLLANYFGINAWSPDFRYLLALETDIRSGLPDGRPCTVKLVDLRTGEAKLLVSCAALKEMVPDVPPSGMSYICHTVISKDMKRVFFLSRSVSESMAGVKKFGGVNWQTTACTCNADGTGIRRCFPDGWGASHFNWKPCPPTNRSTPPSRRVAINPLGQWW